MTSLRDIQICWTELDGLTEEQLADMPRSHIITVQLLHQIAPMLEGMGGRALALDVFSALYMTYAINRLSAEDDAVIVKVLRTLADEYPAKAARARAINALARPAGSA